MEEVSGKKADERLSGALPGRERRRGVTRLGAPGFPGAAEAGARGPRISPGPRTAAGRLPRFCARPGKLKGLPAAGKGAARRPVSSLAGLAAVLLLVGCGHRQKPVPVASQASAPPLAAQPPASAYSGEAKPGPATSSAAPGVPAAASAQDAEFVATHKPIDTEVGMASWYGPPYHNRRGADGTIYDQNAMTAAHRTLPLNSLVMVTNVATGQSAIVRITDRGPFVPGRLLDLSKASALATGVWRPGVARVRVDVYQTPSPILTGGRWCVQIGAFTHGGEAARLREKLSRRYQTANVIEFTGPTGHWVRIRPAGDDKQRASEIARDLRPAEGEAYLVRLD